MLARGLRVVVAAPADELFEETEIRLRPFGERARCIPTDITVRSEIDALVAATVDAFGRIDVLVNLAGIGSHPALCDDTDVQIERVIAVNLLGAARLMHAVLPIMKAQGAGVIVNVGSVAGEAGVMGIYSGTKFGLRGLTDSVRREVRSAGIRVTLVEPGFVRSPMNAGMENLPGPERVAEAIIAAIGRPRRVVIVPRRYRAAVALFNLMPSLTDAVFGDARIQERLNRDARAKRA